MEKYFARYRFNVCIGKLDPDGETVEKFVKQGLLRKSALACADHNQLTLQLLRKRLNYLSDEGRSLGRGSYVLLHLVLARAAGVEWHRIDLDFERDLPHLIDSAAQGTDNGHVGPLSVNLEKVNFWNAHPLEKRVQAEGGHHDFPLDFHDNARRAAVAARCAGEQSKYWEMRHVMIVNAEALKPDNLATYAGTVKIDVPKFKSCLESDKFKAQIDQDVAEGGVAGVQGTPSFVIGRLENDKLQGVRMVGAMPYAQFDAKIQEMLGETAKN